MAVGAQRTHIFSFRLLCVGVVAGLALNSRLPVLAGTPFIRCRLVARGAQCCIRRDWHFDLRMGRLIGAVARFACYTFNFVSAIGWIVAGRMTLQARVLIRVLGPGFLEDRRGERSRMTGGRPFSVNILVTAAAQFRTTIFASRGDLYRHLNGQFTWVCAGGVGGCHYWLH